MLKALLLNGAEKTPGWKSTVADPETTPLDPVTGAGLLNVYNSYQNLIAGEQTFSTTQSGPVAPTSSGAVEPIEGWDLETLTNSYSVAQGGYLDQSNHYLFDLSANTAPYFTLTATLIWWMELNQTTLNNFYLYLFDTDTDQTIACSISTIDNVQEIYVPDLAPGDYDLAVVKSGSNIVSTSDTYALAFNFAPVPEPPAGALVAAGVALLLIPALKRRSCSSPTTCTRSARSFGRSLPASAPGGTASPTCSPSCADTSSTGGSPGAGTPICRRSRWGIS